MFNSCFSSVKFILTYFIHFNVVEIILIVICSLLVYRNTFLKSVTVFWDIVRLVNSVKFSLYRIILSVNKVFYFLPYKQNIFYFVFLFYYIARTFRIRLKRSGASGHSCFVPDLISGKKLFSVHTTLELQSQTQIVVKQKIHIFLSFIWWSSLA